MVVVVVLEEGWSLMFVDAPTCEMTVYAGAAHSAQRTHTTTHIDRGPPL